MVERNAKLRQIQKGCILVNTVTSKRYRLTKSEKLDKVISDRKKEEAVPAQAIHVVFDYYLNVHKADSKRKPLLDAKRRRILAVSIYDYGVDDCKAAIDGCSNSHFHMGQNKQGKVYNSLELIFRDAANIERFIGYNE